MNTTGHYWATRLVAEMAGFPKTDAETIGRMAEGVDELTVNADIIGPNGKPVEDLAMIACQTFDASKPDDDMATIYRNHFPVNPSQIFRDDAARKDKTVHILNCLPAVNEDSIARTLFGEALKTGDPFEIGYAVHVFFDTFVHRDYVGANDPFNAPQTWFGRLGIFRRMAIGHMFGGTRPDTMNLEYEDSRLVHGKVDNKPRFMEAFTEGFKMMYAAKHGGQEPDAATLQKFQQTMSDVIGESNRWADHTHPAITRRIQNLLGDHQPYKEKKWVHEALTIDVHGIQDGWQAGAANVLDPDDVYHVNKKQLDALPKSNLGRALTAAKKSQARLDELERDVLAPDKVDGLYAEAKARRVTLLGPNGKPWKPGNPIFKADGDLAVV